MNDDAELYQENNNLQKRGAIQCLDKYGKKIRWNKFGDRVIDIGCGDGGVTDILKTNYMPPYYSKVVGCDISEEMIRFANEHHGDRRTEFIVLDIEGKVSDDIQESFDHVFSFYALHWIKNQERAFRNIHQLLAPNGDCLLLFVGHMPIYDVYREMSRSSKWRPWLSAVDSFVSPYHDSQDPAKEIKSMLEKIGFENIEVEDKQVKFIYDDIDNWKKAVAAIDPFNIPKELFEDFMEDYSKLVRDMRMVDKANNNFERVSVTYSLLVVYATKKC